MISGYISSAMRRAKYSFDRELGQFFGEISEIPGIWASGDNRQAAEDELREILEEWIVCELRASHKLPELDGNCLEFEMEEQEV